MTVLIGNAHDGSSALGRHLVKVENEVVIGRSSGIPFDTDLDPFEIPEAVDYLAQMGKHAHSQPLIHLSINPHTDYVWTADNWDQAINRTLGEFNVYELPHVIVFHEKADGRRHCHIVALRVAPDGKLVEHMRHSHRRNEVLARTFDVDFCHGDLVSGRHNLAVFNRLKTERPDVAEAMLFQGLTRTDRPTARMSPSERQQAERTGIDLIDLQDFVAQAWRSSDSPAAFRSALRSAHLVLAQGTKTTVVVDRSGNAHSLLRALNKGLKASGSETIRKADLMIRIPANLPNIDAARRILEGTLLTDEDPRVQKLINIYRRWGQTTPPTVPAQGDPLLAPAAETQPKPGREDQTQANKDAEPDSDARTEPSRGDQGDGFEDRRSDEIAGGAGDQFGRADHGGDRSVGDQDRRPAGEPGANLRATHPARSVPVYDKAELASVDATAALGSLLAPTKGPLRLAGTLLSEDKKVTGPILTGDQTDDVDDSKLSQEQLNELAISKAQQSIERWMARVLQALAAVEEEQQLLMQRIRKRKIDLETWLADQAGPGGNWLAGAIGSVHRSRLESSDRLLDRARHITLENNRIAAAEAAGGEVIWAASAAGKSSDHYEEQVRDLTKLSPSRVEDCWVMTLNQLKTLHRLTPPERKRQERQIELTRCGLTAIEDVRVVRGLLAEAARLTISQRREPLEPPPEHRDIGDVFKLSREAIERGLIDAVDGREPDMSETSRLMRADSAAFERARAFVEGKIKDLGEEDWIVEARRRQQERIRQDAQNLDFDPDYENIPKF